MIRKKSEKLLNTMIETGRIVDLSMFIVLWIMVYVGIQLQTSGKRTTEIRKLAALDAIDEALGACAERGKSAFYLPKGNFSGSHTPETLAYLAILDKVSAKCAELNVPLSLIYSQEEMDVGPLMIEKIQQGFQMGGAPELFQDDTIRFFGRIALTAMIGAIERERPGACFYIGHYYAGSLLKIQTGRRVGAMTICGTNATAQMCFMMATCDYTLIGEELFAAGAYISKEPLQIGSLEGQDWGKLIVMLACLIGALTASVGITQFAAFLGM